MDPIPGPQAPVGISATMDAKSARVVITFGQEATDVTVRFRGTDGLQVGGNANPVSGRHCAAGEALPLAVEFTPGPGYCLLAVDVTGVFQGSAATRVCPSRRALARQV